MANRLIVLLMSLLVTGLALAIDEDYDIPYTDTYGYVYDPETGKFLKAESNPASGQNSAAGDNSRAEIGGDATLAVPSDEVRESLETESGSSVFYIWISGGGLLLIAGFLYWFRLKKESAVLERDG